MVKKEKPNKEFLERLIAAVERQLGISSTQRGFSRAIAKALKTTDSTVQRWFDGSLPSAEYLSKIYNIFGLTPNFLLGIEEKSKSRFEKLPIPTLELVDFVDVKHPIKKEDYFTVPLVAGKIAAGRGMIVDENIEDWVIIHKNVSSKKKNLVAIRIDKREGMSMYPILKPDDIIIIDRDDKTITPKGIYAVRIDDECTVKRVQQSDDHLILIPENPEYKVQLINLRIYPDPIIGRVIWCSKKL